MPRTRMGRIAVVGDLVALAALAAFIGFVASGERGGETFFSNPRLAWSMVVAAASAVAAGATGLAGMTRQRERSPLVVASVVLGALVLVWVALEIAFPH